jgi:putative protein kinase ArgK-like GTPase of G3E family
MLVATGSIVDGGHHGVDKTSTVDATPTSGATPTAGPRPPAGANEANAFVPSDGRARPKRPEVLVTTAATGEGVPELLAALDRHRAAGRAGLADAARLARAERQVWAIVTERLRERLHAPGARPATDGTLAEVAAHRLDPYAAADRLLGSLARTEG